MIRLMVLDSPETPLHEVAPRLRGALLWPGPRTVDEIATQKECDAVILLPGSPVGAPVIEQLLRAGKHVLTSIDAVEPGADVSHLSGVARSAKLGFVLVNSDRYLPSRRLIRQQIDLGKLGVPGLVRIHRWDHRAWAPGLVRSFDLVRWYFGKAPNLLFAVQQEDAKCRVMHLGFPGGGMALIVQVLMSSTSGAYHSLSVIGSSGAAYSDDHYNMQLFYGQGAPNAVRTDEGVVTLAGMIQDFVDGIRGERDLPSGQEDWQAAIALRNAAELSLTTSQAVTLK